MASFFLVFFQTSLLLLLSIWYKFGNGMLMGSEDIDIAIHVGEVIDITVGSSIQI